MYKYKPINNRKYSIIYLLHFVCCAIYFNTNILVYKRDIVYTFSICSLNRMSQDDAVDEVSSMPSDEDDDPYAPGFDGDMDSQDPGDFSPITDPESYNYSCLSFSDAKKSLESDAKITSEKLQISLENVQFLLQFYFYDVDKLEKNYLENSKKVLEETNLLPKPGTPAAILPEHCPTCYEQCDLVTLNCKHSFCLTCITTYVHNHISNGNALKIECLQCSLLLDRNFVVSCIRDVQLTDKYDKFLLKNLIETHPLYSWCPGAGCGCIIKVEFSASKPVTCKMCSTLFCYVCKLNYHAPTPCKQFKNWLKKCQDDSETMNYICANTKDCPQCKVSIEKSGGCNHMCCRNCHFDFCWMCLGSWKAHATEYYECSKYKADPSIGDGTNSARESLNKYLHYYSRWKNHIQSLALEELTRSQINAHIQEQIKLGNGTWIDWQHLPTAVDLLLKCRYTLKFTYAYAYYLDGPWKEMFEHHQAQLEREIENLSWKIEHSKPTDTVEIVKQMDITKQKRLTLLHQFTSGEQTTEH